MRLQVRRFLVLTTLVVATGLAATARAEVCVVIEEAHDTLTPSDRVAAVMLFTRQFEAAGERGTDAPCANEYMLSHVKLGETIHVAVSGPRGHREGTALGLDDLPALYNQMARSLMTGKPMSLAGVVDRTNVTEAQAADRPRVASDSVFYSRLGYGGVLAGDTVGVPSVGVLGYRHELDSFAVDVSFLNFTWKDGYMSESAFAGSWVKLEGLYFIKPGANQSPYVGGGLSIGNSSVSRVAGRQGSQEAYWSNWTGSGLQGELTAGYELARASTLRVLVQVDAGLPFYSVRSTSYNVRTRSMTSESRYAPSLTMSIGLGWQRGGHKHR